MRSAGRGTYKSPNAPRSLGVLAGVYPSGPARAHGVPFTAA